VDRRSDIYSLGVTLYKALTGKVPYDGRSPIEVMLKAIEGKHEPIEELRPDAQPEVVALIERMMDRDPERRFQDAGEVATAMLTLSRVIPAGQPA
jgi:serine/threonine-protein kinase